jgi:hypothetical protein
MHVLYHFGEGGREAGSFTTALIRAIACADPSNKARLAAGFPAHVEAVELAQSAPDDIGVLAEIATGADSE